MTITNNNIQNISKYTDRYSVAIHSIMSSSSRQQNKNKFYKKALFSKMVAIAMGAIVLSGKTTGSLKQDIDSMSISNFINTYTIFNVNAAQLNAAQLQIDENELGRRLVAFCFGARHELPGNFSSRALYRRLPNFRDSDLKAALAYSSSSLFNADMASQNIDMDGAESCSTVRGIVSRSRYTTKNTPVFSIDSKMQEVVRATQESVPNYKVYDAIYLLGQLMTLNIANNIESIISTQVGDLESIFHLGKRQGPCKVLNYFLTLPQQQLQSFSNALLMSNNEIFDQNPISHPTAFSTKIKNSLGNDVKPGTQSISGNSLKDLHTLSLMNFQGNSIQGSTPHSFASWKPNTGNVLSLQDAVDFAIYSHRVYGGQVPLQTYVNNMLLQLIKSTVATDLNNTLAAKQQNITFAANEQNIYSFNTSGTTVNLDSIIPPPGPFQGWSISDEDHKKSYLNNHRIALGCLSSTIGTAKDKYDHLMHKPKGQADKSGNFEYYIAQLEQSINSFITARNTQIPQNTPDFSSLPNIINGNNNFNYCIRENK